MSKSHNSSMYFTSNDYNMDQPYYNTFIRLLVIEKTRRTKLCPPNPKPTSLLLQSDASIFHFNPNFILLQITSKLPMRTKIIYSFIHLSPFQYIFMILQESQSERQSRSRSRSRQKARPERILGYEQEQEEFQAQQEVVRSLLRIEQCREQPVDKFVKIIWIYKGKYTYDGKTLDIMMQPRQFLSKLTVPQLEEILPSINNFQKAELKLSSEYVKYWQCLRVLIKVVLSQKKGENVIIEAYKAKIDEMLVKEYSQLLQMEVAIDLTLRNPTFGVDLSFWQTIKKKIEEKRMEHDLLEFYNKFKVSQKEEEKGYEGSDDQEKEEPISPMLGPISVVNPKLITSEEQQRNERKMLAQKIFREQFQKCRERLQQNLSLPKNHNLLNTDIISESTVAYDFITKEIIEFEKYKRLEEDEEQFDDWIPCQTEGRFRDRKPQYINRKRVTCEWNKYNTMHYTEDDPPPKTIQGYKFNIFYPDLYDKQKTPQYYLETTDNPDYCIIKFKAGPPYKDIAFKVLRKEWDFSEKSGFESIFARGILHLYWNFKKPKFRI